MTQTWPPTSPTQPEPAPIQPPTPTGIIRNPAFPGAASALLGGLLIVFGSFLPWLTATAPLIGTINRSGLDGGGDGVITLILGALTILVAVVGLAAMPDVLRLSIITGLITGVVAFVAYNGAQDRIAQAKDEAGEFANLFAANVGAGIWTLFIGAGLAILGGILTRKIA